MSMTAMGGSADGLPARGVPGEGESLPGKGVRGEGDSLPARGVPGEGESLLGKGVRSDGESLSGKALSGETDYELARRLLDEGDCTLVVARDGVGRKFHRRGVADLLSLVDGGGETLRGACVADKVIGKAAAALAVEGGAVEVFGRVMTHDARRLLEGKGVRASWGELAEMVRNRDNTGRCPIDTLCARIDGTSEMLEAIRRRLMEMQWQRRGLTPTQACEEI